MKPEEMRARSGEKVKQVVDLMSVLHLRVEARDRINEQGFIEKIVFWIDDEQYPKETASNAGNADEAGAAETVIAEADVVAEPVPEAENV